MVIRVMETIEHLISKEQSGFREVRGCVDQVVTLKLRVEKHLGKEKKLFSIYRFDGSIQ